MKPKEIIRSSKCTLDFSNTGKKQVLSEFLTEYAKVTADFVNIFWELEKVPRLAPVAHSSLINTWLSARMVQCAGKQASGIVRGTRVKQERRKFVIDRLTTEGKFKKARKLQEVYDYAKVSKPNVTNVNPELDSRFVKIDLNNNTSFDIWLTIGSIGNKLKLTLPIKRNAHFNKLMEEGVLKQGIRLSLKEATFMFSLEKPVEVTEGSTLGIDIGYSTVLSCSDGSSSSKDNHGHDLSSIISKMSNKKAGSRAFERACNHRTNYINWTINQLNLNEVNLVKLEDIQNLRKGSKSSKKLNHWTYSDIFRKIESYCEELGVLIQKVNPTYTSQRCSHCGWVRKSNRKGKKFKCTACGFEHDADLNAARNIALPLRSISKQQRLRALNKVGFYWVLEGQEHIVPATPELRE